MAWRRPTDYTPAMDLPRPTQSDAPLRALWRALPFAGEPGEPPAIDPLLESAHAHAVTGPVTAWLLGRYPDDPRAEAWRRELARLALGEQTLLQGATRVAEAFERRGLPHAFFKGPFLARILPPPFCIRRSMDVDVWVPPACAIEAWDALIELGAVCAFDPRALDRRAYVRLYGYVNAFPPRAARALPQIDLHWRFDAPGSLLRGIDPLAHRDTLTIGDRSFPVFDPAMTALLLYSHGAEHAWSSWRQAADVAAFAVAHPEIDRLALRPLLESSGCAAPFEQALGAVKRRCPCPALPPSDPSAPIAPARRNGLAEALQQLFRPRVPDLLAVRLPWLWMYYLARPIRLALRPFNPPASGGSAAASAWETCRIAARPMAEWLTDMLRDGLRVRVALSGNSMAPTLREGDIVVIRPRAERPPRIGDLAVLRPEPHRLLVHRLIGRDKQAGVWFSRGDACFDPDPPCSASDVLGIVESREHNGRRRRMDGVAGVMRGHWLAWTFPVRRQAVKARMRSRRAWAGLREEQPLTKRA